MRTIPTALKNAFNSKSVELYYAIEFFYDSGTTRVWTGRGNKIINGNTFQGVGNVIGIGAAEEGSDLMAKGIVLSLSGVDPAQVSLALSEPYQGRVCKVYLGSGDNVVQVFSGYMDTMAIQDEEASCTISINVESKLMILEKTTSRRYTEASHQAKYPGDTFFSYTADLADKEIVWGRKER